MKWLATWIMNRIVSGECSDWTLAMRREFDELDNGHLVWAAGCLLACFKKRFVDSILLVLALLAVHFAAPVLAAFVSVPADKIGGFALSQIVAFCYAVPWAFALGVFWPKSVAYITSIGAVVLPVLCGYLFTSELLDMRFFDYILGTGATMLGDLNLFGTIAMIVLWYVCANLGATFSEYRNAT